jgi:hypothetical protein
MLFMALRPAVSGALGKEEQGTNVFGPQFYKK